MMKFTHLIAALALWSDSVEATAPHPDALTLDYSYEQYLLDFRKKGELEKAEVGYKSCKICLGEDTCSKKLL